MTKKFPAAIASQEVLVSEPTTSQLRLIVSLGNGSVLPQDFASQSDSAGSQLRPDASYRTWRWWDSSARYVSSWKMAVHMYIWIIGKLRWSWSSWPSSNGSKTCSQKERVSTCQIDVSEDRDWKGIWLLRIPGSSAVDWWLTEQDPPDLQLSHRYQASGSDSEKTGPTRNIEACVCVCQQAPKDGYYDSFNHSGSYVRAFAVFLLVTCAHSCVFTVTLRVCSPFC
jgi:hypothetical protein